ncbi:MAG: EAL domain-containing protein [Pseudomonadales bacterium]
MAPSKVNATPRIYKSRILVLMREGRFARRTCTHLDSLCVHRHESVSTLALAASALREREIDIVVAEVHADYGDGLRLPSMLKEWSTGGRLKRMPHVLWIGEGDAAPEADATVRSDAEPGAEQGWCDLLNGVPWVALTSHARLARASGIQVEIAQDGGIDALRAGLERLQEFAHATLRAPAALPAVLPTEQDVISAMASAEGLRVVFQPQYDLQSKRMVGAEALIRWQHPRVGDVPPAVLIPMVNRLGLDLLLFSFIEKCAIETLLALDKAGVEIPLAVNASADTICAPGLADRLANQMRRAGLSPKRLKIELTEEMSASDSLRLSASITALRAKGFQVSLDDFGAGAATLALLSQMPFDEMKIDGALVRAVAQAPASREIITGIVALAQFFNLRLVTEGIEDASTIALLCQLGCRFGQGYALARPMEGADFLRNAQLAPQADFGASA